MKGTEFEVDVRKLLAFEWDVTPEVLAGSKLADAFIQRDGAFGKPERYLVEIKAYAEPLGRPELATLLTEYDEGMAEKKADP